MHTPGQWTTGPEDFLKRRTPVIGSEAHKTRSNCVAGQADTGQVITGGKPTGVAKKGMHKLQ